MTHLRWLTSKEVMAHLNLSACQLMHLRVAEKIKFKKVGNTYFYLVKDKVAND